MIAQILNSAQTINALINVPLSDVQMDISVKVVTVFLLVVKYLVLWVPHALMVNV